MKKYTLDNKPKFTYGDIIKVDLSCCEFKHDGDYILKGKIMGIAKEHIVDMWIVDFSDEMLKNRTWAGDSCITFSIFYLNKAKWKFPVLTIPHTCILDENE